jgi:AraC-like DNA-binding protein
MRYREIRPSPVLQKVIQCYWIADGSDLESVQEHSVLPDGCFDIVIDIHPAGPNTIVLTGIWDRPVMVEIDRGRITIGARFYPAAIDAFFSCRVAEYNNTAAMFDESMLNNQDKRALAGLWDIKDGEELLAFLDCRLVMMKLGATFENELLLKARETRLGSNVQDFAAEIGLSTRQLHRQYQNRFGISPKTYFSILRFIHAKNLLSTCLDMELSEIALKSNYYDQAHFIKEFKRFSGFTPSVYRKKRLMSDFSNTID